MSETIAESIERDARAMDRMADAFEVIADTVVAMYKLQVQRFEKDFPVKHEPRDIDLAHLPDTVDRIKADQGATEETTEAWLSDVSDIGPREREFIKKSAADSEASGQSRFDKKASRSRSAKG